MDDLPSGSRENAPVEVTSLVVLGAGLLGLFFGYDWFWMVFLVGFVVLVPLVKRLTGESHVGRGPDDGGRDESERSVPRSKRDALDALRDRYARGELTEAEFERKVETLLETETLERARRRVGDEPSSAPENATERR